MLMGAVRPSRGGGQIFGAGHQRVSASPCHAAIKNGITS
jgi:hypothetical protein